MALKIILLAVIVVFMLLLDLPAILKVKSKKKIKALLAYFFLLAAGFTLGLLLILERKPVSPALIIEKVLNLVLGIGI